jgi:hypothetical protein
VPQDLHSRPGMHVESGQQRPTVFRVPCTVSAVRWWRSTARRSRGSGLPGADRLRWILGTDPDGQPDAMKERSLQQPGRPIGGADHAVFHRTQPHSRHAPARLHVLATRRPRHWRRRTRPLDQRQRQCHDRGPNGVLLAPRSGGRHQKLAVHHLRIATQASGDAVTATFTKPARRRRWRTRLAAMASVRQSGLRSKSVALLPTLNNSLSK